MSTTGMNEVELTEGSDMRSAPTLGGGEAFAPLGTGLGSELGAGVLTEGSAAAGAVLSCSALMEVDAQPAADVVQATAWMGQLRTLPLLSPWAVMQGHHALLEASLGQAGGLGLGAASAGDAAAGTAQLAVVGLLAPDADRQAPLQRCSGDGGWV